MLHAVIARRVSRRLVASLSSCLLTLAAVLAGPVQALPERASMTAEDALGRLRDNTGGALQHSPRTPTAYTMLRATGDRPLLADGGIGTPVERATYFLSLHGAALGITDPSGQLVAQRVTRDGAGNTHAHFDQVHEGLPVAGARTVVHMNGAGITGVSGVFVPNLDRIRTTPDRAVAALRAAAQAVVAKENPGRTIALESGQFVIYPAGLLRGRMRMPRLAYEVAATAGPDVREQVFVDAHTGIVLDHYSLVHRVMNREIYTPDLDAAPSYDEQAGSPTVPAGPANRALINDPGHGSTDFSDETLAKPPLDNLWLFAGGTYELYDNLFGRGGYDACDGDGPCETGAAAPWSPMRSTNDNTLASFGPGQVQQSIYLVNNVCPNAYWNGVGTHYCPGFDADDVVSHEWSHAYTQYTHGLIYYYQSGALNESYSDIFGEAYDLLNNMEGPIGNTQLEEHKYYEEAGSRWVVGEDLSEEAATLLLRDMWDPDNFCGPGTCARNPGKVTSENYYCDSGDGGGVHFNSSVSNHAFAMLVDGKEFNGVTIPAIGMLKALHIYGHAEQHYQTPTTQFAHHADALRASCADLTGVNLNHYVDGSPSGQTIGAADCAALDAAIQATEMYVEPTQCNYTKVLLPDNLTPPVCGDSQGTPIYTENWEGGAIPAGWALGTAAGPTGVAWTDLQWAVSSDLPAPRTGKAAFAVNPGIGEVGGGGSACDPDQDVSGHFWLDSPEFTVGNVVTRLKFTHFHQSESPVVRGGVGADGGNLKFSRNGGPFTVVPKAAFVFNPHSGSILPAANPNTNPNAGQDAWTGVDQGEYESQWGSTIVDFGGLGLVAGDKVRFRWDMSQDACNGDIGWFVDDLSVNTCPVPPVLELDAADYQEPDSDGTYTLKWTRPGDAVGPDLVQASPTCGPLFQDNAASLANWTAASVNAAGEPAAQPAPMWTTSSAKPQHQANSAFWANPVSEQQTQNKSATLTLKQPLAIPQGTTRLSFREWYFNEDDDKGLVEVSTDGGVTWTAIYTNARPMGALPDEGSAAYAEEGLTRTELDLSPYAGQTIGLRFRYALGVSNFFFFVQYGWYVDDILIENDNWGDLLTVPGMSHTLTGQPDGSRCYRVRTQFDIGGNLVPSPFSNAVKATVALVNQLPTANAGADFDVDEGQTAMWTGTGTDTDSPGALSYQWTQTGGPVVTLSGADTPSPSFTAPAVTLDTPFTFELTVTDSEGGVSAADEIVITVVNVATPPPPPPVEGPEETIGNNKAGGLPPATLLMLGLLGLGRRRMRR